MTNTMKVVKATKQVEVRRDSRPAARAKRADKRILRRSQKAQTKSRRSSKL